MQVKKQQLEPDMEQRTGSKLGKEYVRQGCILSPCFFNCIKMSSEAGKVFWCSHLLKNFPQFVMIRTVEVFGIFSEAEIDVFFWDSLAFLMIQSV